MDTDLEIVYHLPSRCPLGSAFDTHYGEGMLLEMLLYCFSNAGDDIALA